MNFLWNYLDELVGKGIGFEIMSKLLYYMSVTFVPMALPLAILLSSLMCFGNLGEYYELVAMKASGISTWKVMRPLLFFSIFMSVIAFVFSNNVLPVATLKSTSLLHDLRKQKMSLDIPEGSFYKGIDKYVIKVGHKSKDGDMLYDVMIYDHTDNRGNTKVTVADSGMMALSMNQAEMVLKLYNGYNYEEITSDKNYKQRKSFQRMSFGEQHVIFDLSEFGLTRTDEDAYKGHYSMLNIGQLTVALDSLDKLYDERHQSYYTSFINKFQHLAKANDKPVANDTLSELCWPIISYFPDTLRADIKDKAVSLAKNLKDHAEFNAKGFNNQRLNIRKHQQAFHKKFSLSIACLLFFFIGAPLGAIIRKGGLGLPVVVSVLFFVVYYVMTITGERVALAGDLPMFVGAWLSSLFFFPIGIFLTFKATTDAALLDGESWKKTFTKVIRLLKKDKGHEHINAVQ